jgi:hypothetical protein
MATTREWTSEQRDPFTDYEARTRYDYEGDAGERSVSSLLGDLAGETSALVRAEVALARKEIQGNLHTAQRGVMAIGAGSGVLMIGVLALVAAGILALAQLTTLSLWQAAAIVGVVITLAGAIMVAIGKRKASAEGIKPARTLGSLNDIKTMAQYEHDRAMRKWR